MRLGGQPIIVSGGSLAAKLYGLGGGQASQNGQAGHNGQSGDGPVAGTVRLRFRHRYEVNPEYIDRLTRAGLIFSGKAPADTVMQILELPGHPYFIGTQSHPCLSSRPLRPEPMFKGLVAAALSRAYPGLRLPDLMGWSARPPAVSPLASVPATATVPV
jgi:CTP synthase